MYVTNIRLHNIRGFENLDFSLQRADGGYAGWTVFTGDNGSGKSTLLKAIVIGLLGANLSNDHMTAILALQPAFKNWRRQGYAGTTEIVEISMNLDCIDDNFIDPNPRKPHLTGSMHLDKSGTATFRVTEQNLEARHFAGTTPPGWFACGYGPLRRVAGASTEATALMSGPITGRFATMFQEAASLYEVDRWLRDLNYKALEGKAEEKNQLDLVLEILRDDLMPNQITVDRVDSDGLWLKDRNGVQLTWSDMSDGYRAAVALLADILRHMINAYGIDGLAARDADGKLFINRSGVVLIDEIDAHLHPHWQREIGFWLKTHFPKIQFLVTTHSPIICQAADDNGLFVLPEPGSGDLPRALTHSEYETVIAARPDTILLSPAFGLQNTRSPHAVQARATYARLQAKQRAGANLNMDESNTLQNLKIFANTNEEV